MIIFENFGTNIPKINAVIETPAVTKTCVTVPSLPNFPNFILYFYLLN